ncbi:MULTISPECIES: TetR/AcrR family transcriptional regulator [unclassified Pseudomonas]|uniref:TetR/AcrR family transcriptional regulator n=1 Tax=unclassified Pseudomonas TaxID=196821 RepID=UPI000F568C41|nr:MULTISPECIES: TetR/AcrR family transcriptional regulator [unclassified Pseudomonas]AZF21431.1 Transcriptional regulator, AcrR family [Pseudomonas sp. R3-52-08]AZF26764.1 Transcriptional regulator, AcrR family [Pseudomonas sp. R2-60-08W]AZF32115.1 Transcriptional regulator, AcrR family [Pseudomonas sp. R4-35-07]
MSTLTRHHWIAAGFEALDQVGHPGVSAESLSRRLNVTRGSFYHHFRNREDFVRALLAAWEEDYTERMLAYAAQGRGAGETLKRYLSIAAEKQPGREISIRAWSLHDPLVGEFQQRVDARRLDFAIRTCRSVVHGPGEAEVMGQMAHLCLIGGQQAGLRRDAARFNRFLHRAVSLFERALSPWRLRS